MLPNDPYSSVVASVFVMLKNRFGKKFEEAASINEDLLIKNWIEPCKTHDIDLNTFESDCKEFIDKCWLYASAPSQINLLHYHSLCKKGERYKGFILNLKSIYSAFSINYDFENELFKLLNEHNILDIDLDGLKKSLIENPDFSKSSPSVSQVFYEALTIKHKEICIPISKSYYLALDKTSPMYNNALLKETRKRIGGFNLSRFLPEQGRKVFTKEYCSVLLDYNSGTLVLENSDNEGKQNQESQASKEANIDFFSSLLKSRKNENNNT